MAAARRLGRRARKGVEVRFLSLAHLYRVDMKMSFEFRRQAIEGTIEAVEILISGMYGKKVQEAVCREWLNGDDSQKNIRKFASRFVKSNLSEFEGLLNKVLSEEKLSECGPAVRRLVRDQDFESSILSTPTIHRPIAKR